MATQREPERVGAGQYAPSSQKLRPPTVAMQGNNSEFRDDRLVAAKKSRRKHLQFQLFTRPAR
jgi:hypothetical protein